MKSMHRLILDLLILAAIVVICICSLNIISVVDSNKVNSDTADYYEINVNKIDNATNEIPLALKGNKIISTWEEYQAIINNAESFSTYRFDNTIEQEFFETNNILTVFVGKQSDEYVDLMSVDICKDKVEIIIGQENVGAEPQGFIIYMIPISKDIINMSVEYENLSEDYINDIIEEQFKYSIAKPIIYLYPEVEQDVKVTLGNPERLTCTYPKYEEGWEVKAKPNGDLVDLKTGRNLYALYWESNSSNYGVKDDGFVVKGEDSASFLEDKLRILGLSDRDAQEFIVYWLPQLEANEWNYIRFQTAEEIESNMPLIVEPKPDTIIRVVMEFEGLDTPLEGIKEQELTAPERQGFTVVEWGGTELGV